MEYEHGEHRKERKKFTGKTYDSVDSIAEFFKQRNEQLGQPANRWERRPAGERAASQSASFEGKNPKEGAAEFIPGSYVRHAKYGRGLVLHREGAGELTKLTVSFPGYGQKKLVQKYAGLEKA